MKKLTNQQMESTQGGFLGVLLIAAVFLVGIAVGYYLVNEAYE